jgi:hypothetical protein
MLSILPSDFLRIQLIELQIYDPFLCHKGHYQNFLDYFTATISEVHQSYIKLFETSISVCKASLIKDSDPSILLPMDPICMFSN